MKTTFTQQQMLDVLTTAWEGGSDYWLFGEEDDILYLNHVRDDDSNITKISFQHNVDGKGWKQATIGPGDIDTVISKIISGEIKLTNDKLAFHYMQILTDEDWHCDADEADVLLQLAAFGEIVYG